MRGSTEWTKRRMRFSTSIVKLLLVALATVSTVTLAQAAVKLSAALRAGETAPDGSVTVVAVHEGNGVLAFSVRNNAVRPVIIDAYTLSPRAVRGCNGTDLPLPVGSSREICSVTDSWSPPSAGPDQSIANTADNRIGHASFQFYLTWHEIRPNAAPASSPSRLPFMSSSQPPQ